MHYLKCFLERSVEGDLSSPVIFAAKLTPNANISERLEAGMPSLMIMFFPKLSLFTFRKSIIEVIVGPGVRQTPFCGSQPQEEFAFLPPFFNSTASPSVENLLLISSDTSKPRSFER